jgi:KTSC domain-containing protein
VKWVRVESRALAAVSYNHEWRYLYLEFPSGDIYCYRGVPVERYDELLVADSKGKYFRRHILNRYPHQRVSRTFPTAS